MAGKDLKFNPYKDTRKPKQNKTFWEEWEEIRIKPLKQTKKDLSTIPIRKEV